VLLASALNKPFDHSDNIMKYFKCIYWVVMLVAVFSVRPALADQFLANSIVINMGITPQTVNNGVKPYGLVDALIDGNIPVYWAIDNAKSKDGVDFTVGGTSFRGGSFVIPSEFATQAGSIVATWTAQGVVVFNAPVDFVAPANGQAKLLNYIPLAVGTRSIINTLFYNQSGISKIRLNDRPFVNQTADQGGGGLGRCEDVIAMPHEDPHDWTQSEADRLACFIDTDNSEGRAGTCNNIWSGAGGIGGNYTRTTKGYMWAACHSVSAIEASSSGNGGYLGLNFLTTRAMISWESGAHNNNNTPPFTYPSTQVPAVGNINAENVMQFMSTLDGALSGGSEEIYQPDSKGWRDETIIGVHDPDHSSVPEEAALVAFGYGYGDPDNGYLVYEASHNLNSGNVQENVAAARVYGNFLLSAGLELAPRVDQVSIEGIVVSGSGQIVTGSSNQLLVQATGGDESFYAYSWADTCGGSFNNTTIANPIYNAPAAADDCSVTIEVSDACGRSTFSAIPVTILSLADLTITKSDDGNGPYSSGDPLVYTIVVTNSGSDADNVMVTDTIPSGLTRSAATTTTLGTCNDLGDPNIVCDIGTLGAGLSATVTITTTVN
jgi:uncharacterized repeat protein (TIGR01451 family)